MPQLDAHRPIARLLLCAIALLVACPAVRAQDAEYREPAAHWSVKVPPGWRPMADESIKAAMALVTRGNAKVNWAYTGGFARSAAADMTYPYVLVQTIRSPMQGATFEDIERSLGAALDKGKKQATDLLPELLANAKINQPVLDRQRSRLYTKLEIDVTGIGRVKGLSVGFLGAEGILQLNFYSKGDQFDADLPEFNKFIDGFAYDAGYAFTPASARATKRNTSNAVPVAGAAVVIIIVVAAARRRSHNLRSSGRAGSMS